MSLNGRIYEAPVHLIGKVVGLLYHENDPARVEVLSEGLSYGMLQPLDLQVNCRIRRRQQIVELLPPQTQQTEPQMQRRYEGGRLFEAQEDDHGV